MTAGRGAAADRRHRARLRRSGEPGRPPHLKIADELRRQIRTGRYKPGERVPPVPALAAQHGVTDLTARGALGVLEEEGLISTETGLESCDSFVADPRPPAPSPGRSHSIEYLELIARDLRTLPTTRSGR